MIFLPLIESWYDPHAYSRAAAVGMWQFMTATGEAWDCGWTGGWTSGAIRCARPTARSATTGMRENFGSVYLAAAAYNGGSGRISRGLAQHASALEGSEGDDLFFALAEQRYLRAETRDYVPKLIAAALVGRIRRATTSCRAGGALPLGFGTPPATPLAAVAKAPTCRRTPCSTTTRTSFAA